MDLLKFRNEGRHIVKITDEMLNAAEEILKAKGFEAATVDDICNLARSSRPTFYKRFKDKNGLFTAYVRVKSHEMSEALEGLVGVIQDKESFIAQARAYLTYMYQEDVLNFHCLVAGEARHNEEMRQLFRNQLVNRHAQMRERAVTQLIIAGLITPTRDIPRLARLLGSLITADSYYLTVAGGQDPLSGEALDAYVRERCELFLRIANEPSNKA